MKTSFVLRIGYKEIFNCSAAIEKYLDSINTEQAIEFLVSINKYEHEIDKNKLTDLNFICNEWLENSNIKLKNKIINCYNAILLKNNSKNDLNLKSVRVINKTTTLRCIEILLSKAASNYNDPLLENFNENLFLFYLTVNDEIATRDNKLFEKWMRDFKVRKNEVRFHLFLGLAQVFVNPEAANKKIWVEAIKFVQFEKWMRNNEKFKEFEAKYLQQFGVSKWYELLTIVFHINNLAMNQIKITQEIDQRYWKFLSYFADHNKSSIEWNDLTEIRKNPIYRLKNGDYLIIDFGYLLDKFFSGIYHDMVEFSFINEAEKFHQIYSKEFLEEFLLITSLRAVFGDKYIQFSEKKIKSISNKNIENLALPDYYIRNGNKVFLIECKNSYLSNKLKIEINSDALERDIIDKFYYTGKKKKAIKQLVNFILLSQNGEYDFFDGNSKLQNIIYYPILVVTDLTLTSPGFNHLLNEYFDIEMKIQIKEVGTRVKPITVVHINDLLYRTSKLKKLDHFINDYHKYCLNNKMMDGMISFTNYLDIIKFQGDDNIDHKSIEHIMKNSILSY